ncbi:hypothetical protein [Mucilaginibacter phyllosphaerae]|uniref:Uncharacterized protein n=1 Tax=Mucilaginibacter phyllosphaerae TaxID=1812349 RepID=A0A4Y8A5D1_9SPHI|nr:hypothetical protein [Mucilaginibacter phyllosphaerae]MBB3969524.1 hypothetical protein [Mucilaginibacter phyllosphaerae]TEW63621.1 hypothetical protein E2R65_19330 [Mucilaginibacter phyllosphaerae]GGH23867.1 hypothetical protein GCM10007352_38020 [Mucilaginibacter phyllosphaerae]
MNSQIIIETDPAGQRLYEICQEGFALYTQQLDQQQQWSATLNLLEERNPELFKTMGYQQLKGLLMTTSLLCIAATDLSVVVSALYLAKQRLEQIFYMKSAYLIIYETYIAFQDKQLLIKNEAAEAGAELQAAHLRVSTAWRKFVNDFKVGTEVKKIRHQTGGHIHQNFSEWYTAVCRLEPQHTTNMLIAFLAWIQDSQNLVNPLLQRRLSLLQETGKQANEKTWELLWKMEDLQKKVNIIQPEGNKLDLDFSLLRNLLKRR